MQTKKQELKEKIIAVATKEFLENGFLKASIRKIARECEITPGNLYHYFTNKEDLYVNITLKFNQERVEYIYKEMRKGKSAEDKLRNYALAYLKYAQENRDIFRLSMYYQLNGLNEESFSQDTKLLFQETITKNMDEFVEIIETGIENKEFSARYGLGRLITSYTMSLRIALNEVVLLKYRDEGFYREYLDFLLYGLLKREEE